MSFINLAEQEEQTSSSLLPKGDYPLALYEWEQCPTQKGLGLKLQFIVLDGEYKDRRIFEFYNVQHPNAQAVAISGAALKSFIIACGFDGNQLLTEELMNAATGKAFVGQVGIAKAKPDSEYDDQNRVVKFFSNQQYAERLQTGSKVSTTAPTTAAPQQVQTAPAPATSAAPPSQQK